MPLQLRQARRHPAAVLADSNARGLTGGTQGRILVRVDARELIGNLLPIAKVHNIEDIDVLARGKLPIVAGGTNLYIDSLIAGLDFADNEQDNALREALGRQYDTLGGEAMLERLRGFDPERAEKLHPADKRRIVRAIEVYELTGKTITEHDRETKMREKRYDAAKIALCFEDRQELYDRINARVDEMVREGLYDEVKRLLDAGLSPECTAMQAIGYKEPAAYFAGQMSMDEATELIKLSSRRYAKRQLTWLRRDEDIFWLRWGNIMTMPGLPKKPAAVNIDVDADGKISGLF